jgi:hypothetical protein
MSTELAELLDSQPFPGISLLFILLFFAPLVLIVAVPLLFVKRSLRAWIRGLTIAWSIASVPACAMLAMGYAFNPHGWFLPIQLALWVGAGVAIVWLPLRAKQWLSRV